MKKSFFYFAVIFLLSVSVTSLSSCEKKDTTPPVITILGDNPVTVCVDATYVDAGAEAYDDVDGDVTSTITATSTVVTAEPGVYSVTYRANDKSGNFIVAERTVNVIFCK